MPTRWRCEGVQRQRQLVQGRRLRALADINHDGKDRRQCDRTIVGNRKAIPAGTGSMSNRVTFHNFDLSALVTGEVETSCSSTVCQSGLQRPLSATPSPTWTTGFSSPTNPTNIRIRPRMWAGAWIVCTRAHALYAPTRAPTGASATSRRKLLHAEPGAMLCATGLGCTQPAASTLYRAGSVHQPRATRASIPMWAARSPTIRARVAPRHQTSFGKPASPTSHTRIFR